MVSMISVENLVVANSARVIRKTRYGAVRASFLTFADRCVDPEQVIVGDCLPLNFEPHLSIMD